MWNCKKCGTLLNDDQVKCNFCRSNRFESENQSSPQIKNGAENVLKNIGIFILVVGIICSILLFIAGIYLWKLGGYEKDLATFIFTAIIPTLLSSIATWAFSKILVNISLNVKEIKHNMHK